MKCDTMINALCVSMPLEDLMIANLVCRKCMLKIGEAQLKVDLMVIPLQDFDVILGMDWLSEHHVTLNCFMREVKIDSLGQLATMFHGEKQGLASYLVSATRANKMIESGCEAYLVWVVDTQTTSKQ